jgi:hypothetical protein
MIDHKSIRECFTGLVGITPVYDGVVPALPASLLSSETGYYLGPEMDSLLGVDTIFHAANSLDNYSETSLHTPFYDAGRSYERNALVLYGNQHYRSKTDQNVGNEPTDTDYWEESSVLGEFLRNKMEAAALQTVQAILRANRIESGTARTLLSNSSLYNGLGAVRDEIQKRSRFVGIRIQIKHSNVLFQIRKLATQFAQTQTNLPLYLYKDGVSQPIKVWTVTTSSPGSMETHDIDPYTERLGMSLDFGTYKLGYYEQDLAGNAIHKKVAYTTSSCASCDAMQNALLRQNSGHLSARPFYVPVDDIHYDTKAQWATEDEEYEITHTNFGLNMWLSLTCDLTEFIQTHRLLFLDAYLAKLKAVFMKEIAITRRANPVANSLRGITLQVGGNAKVYNQDKGPKILTDDVETEFEQIVQATTLDVSGLDKECLPHTKAQRGIRIGSV